MLCLCAISMMFVKIMLAVYMVMGTVDLSERGLCVFRALCPFCFVVVGESPSVLL